MIPPITHEITFSVSIIFIVYLAICIATRIITPSKFLQEPTSPGHLHTHAEEVAMYVKVGVESNNFKEILYDYFPYILYIVAPL